ncbi:MAG: YihY/virulence factor BrkB family protein [Myxococcales bacterium]|nr:YihY/virulence factor BrkB family protein [Myxococcales bacterium]
MALLRRVLKRFHEIGGPLISAGIAFYAFLSAAPLAVIAVAIAGMVFGETAARGELHAGLVRYLGAEGAGLATRLILSTHDSAQGLWASAISLVIMAFAASRLFAELERALNLVWGIAPKKPEGLRNKTKAIFNKRMRAFAYVLAASLGLMAVLLAKMLTDALLAVAPGTLLTHPLVIDFLQFAGLIVTLTGFNAVVFANLPRTDLSWRDVRVGAIVTAFLVAVGALVAGLYTRQATLTSTYGAAGTFALILIWAYYSCQVFVLGAVFTCIWTGEHSMTTHNEFEHHAATSHHTVS